MSDRYKSTSELREEREQAGRYWHHPNIRTRWAADDRVDEIDSELQRRVNERREEERQEEERRGEERQEEERRGEIRRGVREPDMEQQEEDQILGEVHTIATEALAKQTALPQPPTSPPAEKWTNRKTCACGHRHSDGIVGFERCPSGCGCESPRAPGATEALAKLESKP